MWPTQSARGRREARRRGRQREPGRTSCFLMSEVMNCWRYLLAARSLSGSLASWGNYLTHLPRIFVAVLSVRTSAGLPMASSNQIVVELSAAPKPMERRGALWTLRYVHRLQVVGLARVRATESRTPGTPSLLLVGPGRPAPGVLHSQRDAEAAGWEIMKRAAPPEDSYSEGVAPMTNASTSLILPRQKGTWMLWLACIIVTSRMWIYCWMTGRPAGPISGWSQGGRSE
jgi:hypothetical protein